MVFDLISDFFSDLSSAVSDFAADMGSIAKDFFVEIATNIGPILEVVGPVVKALAVVFPQLGSVAVIVDTLNRVFKALGISDRGMEEIGQDVLDAHKAGIRMDEYDTYDAYKQAMDNFRLDKPDEFGKYTSVEKIAAGLSILTWATKEKFGPDSAKIIEQAVLDMPNIENGEGYFTSENMKEIITNIDNLGDVVRYFSGDVTSKECVDIEQKLVDIAQKLAPEKSEGEIYSALDKLRQN